jgi:type I restriction enzyme R subunit
MLSRNFGKGTSADAVDALPKGTRNNKEAASETVENNVHKLIIEEQPINLIWL